MNFYKIIDISSNKILRVATDRDIIFIKNNQGGLVALKDATKSQPCGIIVNSSSYFLADTNYPAGFDYPIVTMKIIGLNEFSDLKEILSNNNVSIVDPNPIIDIITDETTLETARSVKIEELQDSCRQEIIKGINVVFDNYTEKHFDLTIEDQLNLNTLRYQLLTTNDSKFAYHSKGNSFEYFTRKQIEAILLAMDNHILYQNTYFNSLKNYVNSLTDITTIKDITYGQDFPSIYKSSVLLDITK